MCQTCQSEINLSGILVVEMSESLYVACASLHMSIFLVGGYNTKLWLVDLTRVKCDETFKRNVV